MDSVIDLLERIRVIRLGDEIPEGLLNYKINFNVLWEKQNLAQPCAGEGKHPRSAFGNLLSGLSVASFAAPALSEAGNGKPFRIIPESVFLVIW